MNKIVDFFKSAGMFFIATDENGQPRVRPFGELFLYENELYFNTNCEKKVFQQIIKNPNVELCAFHKGKWMRVSGQAIEGGNETVKTLILGSQPAVHKMYAGKENIFVIFKLENISARLCQFGKEEKIL